MGVEIGYSWSVHTRTTQINQELPPPPGQDVSAQRSQIPPAVIGDDSLRRVLGAYPELSGHNQLFQDLIRLNSSYGTLLERYSDQEAVGVLSQFLQQQATPEQAGQQLDELVDTMARQDTQARIDAAEPIEVVGNSQSASPGSNLSIEVNVDAIDDTVSGQLTYINVFSSSADTRRQDTFRLQATVESESVTGRLGVSYTRATEREAPGIRTVETGVGVDASLAVD